MRYAQIENGKVINVIELNEGATEWQGLIVVPSESAGIGDDYIGGEFVKPVIPQEPETPEQTIARLDRAIEAHIQEVVTGLGYVSVERLTGTYANSPNPKWKAESEGAVLWITAIWETALQVQSDVINGNREIPTEEELIAQMPSISDFIIYPA